MRTTIDWEALGRRVGSITNDGHESGSSTFAKEALALLIGSDQWRDTVDWYVRGDPGSELVRCVLWLLQPKAARDRCFEVWRSDAKILDRRVAVGLLRWLATPADLPVIREMLDDDDHDIRMWALSAIEQMAYNDKVTLSEVEPLLATVLSGNDDDLHPRCADIRQMLTAREAGGEA